MSTFVLRWEGEGRGRPHIPVLYEKREFLLFFHRCYPVWVGPDSYHYANIQRMLPSEKTALIKSLVEQYQRQQERCRRDEEVHRVQTR